MAKVRTLDKSVRLGALLAGIPLLISGFIPLSIDPLVFVWNIARNTSDVVPLLPAAAGLMLTAIGLVPGLPRLARGLLVLVFTVAPFVVAYESLSEGGGFGRVFESTAGLVFLAAIAFAAVTETLSQGQKNLKIFATLALIGWLVFLAQYAIPWEGGDPLIVNLVDTYTGIPDININLGAMVVLWPLLVLTIGLVIGLLAALFALLRILRSTDKMLAGRFRSGWAAVLVAGGPALVFLGTGLFVALEAEATQGVLLAASFGMVLWGFCVGVTSGLSHTLLGFLPAPVASAQRMERPVYQPEKQPAPFAPQPPQFTPQPPQFTPQPPQFTPQPPQFGQQQYLQQQERERQERERQERERQMREQQEREQQERERQLREQQERERQMREQQERERQLREQQERERQLREQQEREQQLREQQERERQLREQQGQAAAQAQARAASDLPRGQDLPPYPGYDGYVICPNCRGGVAVNGTQCSHCGQQIAW